MCRRVGSIWVSSERPSGVVGSVRGPFVAGLASAAGTAPRVMRPSPSVTSVGARRDPCKPVPFVVFTGPTPLDSCVVSSGIFTSVA